MLWELSFIALAVILTFLPRAALIVEDKFEPYYMLIAVWVAAALLSELSELLPDVFGDAKYRHENLDLWMLDRLNVLELPGLILAFAAIVVIYLSDSWLLSDTYTLTAQALTGMSLMLLWTATGLRAVSLLPSVGPMVRMSQYMVADVLQWLVLLGMLARTTALLPQLQQRASRVTKLHYVRVYLWRTQPLSWSPSVRPPSRLSRATSRSWQVTGSTQTRRMRPNRAAC